MTTNKTDSTLPAVREGSLPVIKAGQDLHQLVHQVFTPDKFNVLVPKAMSMSPGINVAIQQVELDWKIDEKKKRSKDFWSIDGEEYILSSNAIRKIAGAANIQWVADQCKIESEQYDANGQILRLRYKAVCTVTTSLGTVKNGIGTYEYNYQQDLKDKRFLEYEWNAKDKKKVYTGALKMDQINQRRQFAIQLVESGAKARAIYDAFGIMEKSYKREDISKPFIVPCAVHDIDYNDPAVKKMVAERALGIKSEVYGPEPIKVDFEEIDSRKIDKQTGEVIEPKPTQEIPPESAGLPEAPEPAGPSDIDKRAIFRDGWQKTTSDERAKKIQSLIDKAGVREKFKQKNYSAPESWSEESQLKWIMELAERVGEIPKDPEAKS